MPVFKKSSKKYQGKRSGRSRAAAYARYGKASLSSRVRPVPSHVRDVQDVASCSCTISTANPVVNQMYQFNTLDLNSFPRAVQIAQAYQMFRMKKITFRFRPTFDTYAANAGSSKMNLYYMIDKTGSIPPNPTLNSLKQMGAKPVQLDEEVVEVSWAPSVLDAALLTAGAVQVQGGAQYQISPWLSTNNNKGAGAWAASTIDHLGISFIVEQAFSPEVTSYELEVEVQFEFKKPLWIEVAPPGQQALNGDALINSQNGQYIGAGAGH